MRTILQWWSGFVAWVCRIFGVTPDSLRRGRRGNLPPPTGGIGSS